MVIDGTKHDRKWSKEGSQRFLHGFKFVLENWSLVQKKLFSRA